MEGREPLQPSSQRVGKLTYDDFLQFPDDGQRHELIDGAHYVTPSPITRHQRLVLRLLEAFLFYLRDHPAGEVFSAPFDVVLGPNDVVEPDLLFIAADQSDILTEKHVRGAPAIVVEVLSPGTRRVDEQAKRRLYDRAGVREYWVVDPEVDEIAVYRRADDGRFPLVDRLSRGNDDSLTTPLLPAFDVALHVLFR